MSQNPGGKNLLEFFKERLGCGYLKLNHPKNSRDKSWVLIVKDRKDLKDKLIPFFDKYNLHSQKKHDLETLKKVIKIVESRGHLSRDGLTRIVNLVFNTSRITKKRYSKEEILNAL